MIDIWKNVIASLISAVIIAIIFGVWNDNYYKKEDLSGYWEVEFVTVETDYSPDKDLKTYYYFTVGQNGHSLSGFGEKTSEDSSNGKIQYETKNRTHLEFQGAISYRVFSKSRVNITYRENGRRRPFSTVLSLVVESSNRISGTYISTAANTKGTVTFERVEEI